MTTRTVRHPALAQNLRYACNPPIHEGSPLTKVRGAGGEKRQHLPLDTEHGHYFSSLLGPGERMLDIEQLGDLGEIPAPLAHHGRADLARAGRDEEIVR